MGSNGSAARAAGAVVLATALGALFFWLCSYSWIIGWSPPTGWISAEASPWLVAEIAAVVAGAVSLGLGAVITSRHRTAAPRGARSGAALGGVVLVLTLASLLMPA